MLFYIFQFCIIITGGSKSNSSAASANKDAQRLKAKGVSINIVAVDSNDPSQDLYQIASTIDHVRHAKNIGSVSEKLSEIARKECQGE